MSRKPATARHRTDTGSAELIKLLKASGIDYEPLGGAIDGAAWHEGVVKLIDFKSNEKAPLTPTQWRLLGRGCPVHYVWNAVQVRLLATAMKLEANDRLPKELPPCCSKASIAISVPAPTRRRPTR